MKLDPHYITEACHGVVLARALLENNFEWHGPGTILDYDQETCKKLDTVLEAMQKLYQHIDSLADKEFDDDGAWLVDHEHQ